MPSNDGLVAPSEPTEAARAARLRYVSDATPGLSRRRAGSGFRYLDAEGRPLRDEETLTRIRGLVLPPAWTDVWICPFPNGHLQATGRDARKRKQYRYHTRWRAVRDETKYHRLQAFAEALPAIRRAVNRHLELSGLPRDKLLAAIVHLLESTFMRVGNVEYERANGSFGLTTLKDRHATVDGAEIRFRFRGKSGKTHAISLNNRRLARIIKRSRDLPGQDLFQYLGDDDEPQRINSSDVNDYLRTTSGEDFTAKDFRTWAGTLLASRDLTQADPADPESEKKARVVQVIAAVAEQLGNTAAICRKCYVHPDVIKAYLDPGYLRTWKRETQRAGARKGLSAEEARLLRFLRATGKRNGRNVRAA